MGPCLPVATPIQCPSEALLLGPEMRIPEKERSKGSASGEPSWGLTVLTAWPCALRAPDPKWGVDLQFLPRQLHAQATGGEQAVWDMSL